jgi:hypothetical protein
MILKQVLVLLHTIVLTGNITSSWFCRVSVMISTGKYGTYSAYDSANQNYYYTVEGKQYSDFA